MNCIKSEFKIVGINLILVSAAVVALFTLLAVFGGDLLHLSSLGFEVIFPFFAAIAVGEWGKTRADSNYDVISAQSKSLFSWVFFRFFIVFATVSLFALISMVIVHAVRNEMPLWEIMCIYFPPAFLLASLSALFNICYKQEHISTLICGVIWLLTMITKGLLRFPLAAYLYLFVRYAGIQNGVWFVNKVVLMVISLFLWGIIYIICRREH
ncbi:MAG: hypothetical protein PHR92_14175 [Lachnospiraceae bacterium]|nr:hypothetical protein [Lachnospiraceae bacterium]